MAVSADALSELTVHGSGILGSGGGTSCVECTMEMGKGVVRVKYGAQGVADVGCWPELRQWPSGQAWLHGSDGP